MRALFAFFLLLAAVLPAAAVNPDEVLPDPALEERAREISAKLRCLVCQNQSIDDSDATLARDLRILVRERLVAGDSNAATIDYIVARYGEFVLLQPRFAAHTLVLWLTPAVAFAFGIGFLVMRRRRTAGLSPTKLTGEEEKALAALLERRD